MKGTITITLPTPAAIEFSVVGDLAVTQTIDRPSKKQVTVTLTSGGKACSLTLSGSDYVLLSEKWATDQDLLDFIVQKFNLTP